MKEQQINGCQLYINGQPVEQIESITIDPEPDEMRSVRPTSINPISLSIRLANRAFIRLLESFDALDRALFEYRYSVAQNGYCCRIKHPASRKLSNNRRKQRLTRLQRRNKRK